MVVPERSYETTHQGCWLYLSVQRRGGCGQAIVGLVPQSCGRRHRRCGLLGVGTPVMAAANSRSARRGGLARESASWWQEGAVESGAGGGVSAGHARQKAARSRVGRWAAVAGCLSLVRWSLSVEPARVAGRRGQVRCALEAFFAGYSWGLKLCVLPLCAFLWQRGAPPGPPSPGGSTGVGKGLAGRSAASREWAPGPTAHLPPGVARSAREAALVKTPGRVCGSSCARRLSRRGCGALGDRLA